MQLALAYDASHRGDEDWMEVLAWFRRAVDVLGHKEVAYKLDIAPSQLTDALNERERKDVKAKWFRTVLRMCPEPLQREYLELEARQLGYEVKRVRTRTPEEENREMRATRAVRARDAAADRQGDGAMRERPILFSAPMVRAILEGRKTQTRRIVKSRHLLNGGDPGDVGALTRLAREYGDPIESNCYGVQFDCDGLRGVVSVPMTSPFGEPGDRLWVRETFVRREKYEETYYRADHPDFDPFAHNGWRPSIFMPRKWSRITLEVTGVRVERLHAISEQDAQAEGAEIASVFRRRVYPSSQAALAEERGHRVGFENLWHEINGRESWLANPWVWVVEFRRVDAAAAATEAA